MVKLERKVFQVILLKIMKHPCIFGVIFTFIAVVVCWTTSHFFVVGTAVFPKQSTPIFPVRSYILDIANGSLETLDNVLHTSDLRFVAFYAPWCAQSRKMVPKVLLAAEKLKKKIRFIAINCWIGSCKRNFPLHEFPKFFAYHTKYPPVEFLEPPDAWRIIRFLHSIARPFHYVGNEQHFNEIIASHQAVVVGYFNVHAASNKKFSTFLKLCISSVNRVSKILYGIVTNSKMAALAGLRKYGQIILHQMLRNKIYFPDNSNYTADSIYNWIVKSQFEIVKQLTPNMTHLNEYISELKRGPSLLLFLSFRPSFAKQSNELLRQYRIAATHYSNCTSFGDLKNEIPLVPIPPRAELNQKQLVPDQVMCRYPCSLCMTVNSSSFGTRCSICRRCTQSKCFYKSQLNIHLNNIQKFNLYSTDSSRHICQSFQRDTYYYPDIISICCFKEVSFETPDIKIFDKRAKELQKKYSIHKNLANKGIDKTINLDDLDFILNDSMKMLLETMHKLSKLDANTFKSTSSYEKILQEQLADQSRMHGFKDEDVSKTGEHEEKKSEKRNAESMKIHRNSIHTPDCLNPPSLELPMLSELPMKHRNRRNFSTSDFNGLRCKTNRTVNYFYLDIDIHKTMVSNLGIDRKMTRDLTSLALVDLKNEATYVLHETIPLSRKTIVEFVTNFTNGRLERRLRSAKSNSLCSEAINSTCIYETTTNTFQEIVLDDSKDVLLMYYAPWCGYCKQGYKVLLQLALVYSGIHTLRFAKIDAERNDLPYHYTVDGYPAFILFPRKRKFYSPSYPGNLPVTFKDMSHFLQKHCSKRTRRNMKLIKSGIR